MEICPTYHDEEEVGLLDEEKRFENFRFRRIAADEPLKRSRLHRLNHQGWSGMKRKKERKKKDSFNENL